jgi:hypothetical protein
MAWCSKHRRIAFAQPRGLPTWAWQNRKKKRESHAPSNHFLPMQNKSAAGGKWKRGRELQAKRAAAVA